MTTYKTGNPVGSSKPKDLYDNAENLDYLMLGPLPYYADRLGTLRLSWKGIEQSYRTAEAARESQFQDLIASSGYQVLGDYAAGLTFTSYMQVVLRNGLAYRLAYTQALPYTLTGTWATDSTKLLLVGDSGLRQDLANSSDLNLGAGLIAGVNRVVNTVAEMKALPKGRYKYVATMGYSVAGDGGGGFYFLSTGTDNGGTLITTSAGDTYALNHDGRVSLKQFGAKGDDAADDTAAVQRCLNWAGLNNAGVYVPTATVAYKLTAPITIVNGLYLFGDSIELAVGAPGSVNTRGQGSWFHLAHSGRGFSCNANGTTPLRITIEQIGTYRDQPTPANGVTYVAGTHDFDFYLYNCDSVMKDFVTLNPTRGVQITATVETSQSRASFSGWRGQPLVVGLQVDFCADVVRFDDVHFWPYWASHPTIYDYMALNSFGFVSYRNDNPMVTRYFTYGYAYSIYMGSNAIGSTSKMKLQEFDFDAFGKSAIYIDGTNASIQVNQGSAQGKGSAGATVANNFLEFSPGSSGCFAQVTNVDAGLTRNNLFRVAGSSNNTLFIGSCVRGYQWNGSNVGFPALEATANNYIVLDSFPYLTAPLNGGGNFAATGDVRGKFYFRSTAYTSDANGQITIPHGLGRVPLGSLTQVLNASTPYNLQTASHGVATSIFILRNPMTGAVVPNQSVNISAEFLL